MKCIVKTDFRKRFWNIGDTVELFGDDLRRLTQSGDVEPEGGEVCHSEQTSVETLKNSTKIIKRKEKPRAQTEKRGVENKSSLSR